MFLTLFGLLVAVAVACFIIGRCRSVSLVGANYASLHSLPGYHGSWLALTTVGLPLLILIVWSIVAPNILRQMLIGQFSGQL